MRHIKIGNRYVGEKQPVFIIAEIGSNHNQDFKIGKKLIDVAFSAGVDAVKFQSFTVENWISRDFESFPTLDKKVDVYKQLKRCELPYSMYGKLKGYAERKGLLCFSSPSHKEDVDRLYKIGVPVFKFGSVQITDLPTISYAAKKRKPIILSTGASSLIEIKEAVRAVYLAGNRNVILLHCTALYPTKMHQVNLKAIDTLRDVFKVLVGYSDHTLDPLTVPTMAVALGACVIEKHITLNRKMRGPDQSFALEPEELKDMVKAIRQAEKALGSKEKRQLPEELDIANMGRRSIIACVDIAKGTKITKDMLTTKRPGLGIYPKYLKKVVNMVAAVDIAKDEMLTWKNIK